MTRKRPDVQPCGERHEHYLHCLTCNPPPPERPEKLQGPEVGTLCNYLSRGGVHEIVRVLERSYVWGPGDPSYRGGSRRYDWKVIERLRIEGTTFVGTGRTLCVDDKDLTPIHPATEYALDGPHTA